MKSGPTCALFEADGGAWKFKAMKRIMEYLEEELREKIDSKKVYIIGKIKRPPLQDGKLLSKLYHILGEDYINETEKYRN